MMKTKRDTQEKKAASSVKEDLIFLLLKITILTGFILITFVFIFGIYRNTDDSMHPALKDGDLALYYRLQKDYQVSDVVIIKKDGEKQVRRIIAKEGDVVDITTEGLMINGYLQQEYEIYTETLPYKKGITFPLTLGKGEFFVLGDHRSGAKDSRIYGAVREKEIKGSVVTIIRRRGI